MKLHRNVKELHRKLEEKYKMRFQRIVILGNGKIAVDCLYELLNYAYLQAIGFDNNESRLL